MKNNRLFAFGGLKVISCEAHALLEGFVAPETRFSFPKKGNRAGKGKIGGAHGFAPGHAPGFTSGCVAD